MSKKCAEGERSTSKKCAEMAYVEGLFSSREDLRLHVADGPEPPDFELGTPPYVALEVTRLADKGDKSQRSQMDRFESELKSSLRKADIEGAFHLSYSPKADTKYLNARCQRAAIVTAFVALMKAKAGTASKGEIYAQELIESGLPGLNYVLFGFMSGGVVFSRSRAATGSFEERILEAIKRKSDKVVNYPGAYRERWLLLVNSHFSEPEPADIPERPVTCHFDRVFYLKYRPTENEVVEIATQGMD